MKLADLQKIHAAGLITDEQRQRIIAHFGLKEEGRGVFLTILSTIGAVLVAAGVILLISANWDSIPKFVKIATALGLLLGAHACGYYLREVRKDYLKTAEALHLLGSLLFLANIALVGQIYHLSSRPPNAILLWWAGFAALPWLLRSKAQFVLFLLAFTVWFGMEVAQRDSLLHTREVVEVALLSLLGLAYFGWGGALRRTSYANFSGAGEKLGLLLFHGFLYPHSLKFFYHGSSEWSDSSTHEGLIFGGLATLAFGVVALQINRDERLTSQWRFAWLVAFAACLGTMALVISDVLTVPTDFWCRRESLASALVAVAWFVLCVIQIQAGAQLQSRFLINLGIACVALNLITTYLQLIVSMAQTGWMFLLSGVFLIGLGIYLEKKRRALLHRFQTPPPALP